MILPPVFHSLEIKSMMFLHLLRSFGSKIAKLPHVLTFFFNFTLGGPPFYHEYAVFPSILTHF